MTSIPVIAEGHNLIPNPSLESGSPGYGVAGSGSTAVVAMSYSTEWAYSGQRSLLAQITTAGTGVLITGMTSVASFRAVVEPGKPYSASGILRPTVPNTTGNILLIFVDASGSFIGSSSPGYQPLVANVPNRLSIENVLAPPGTTSAIIRFNIRRDSTGWSVGDKVFHDGFQLNEGTTVDHYIDGDQGDLYEWLGTPHASPSIRRAFQIVGPTGTGGVIDVRVRVYKTTRRNDLGEEITPFVLGGSWNWDIDRDGPKTVVKLNLMGRDIIAPMDWIAIYLDVDYENGNTESGQLGIFRMELPDIRYSGEGSEVEVSGFDPLILLADRTLETNVTLPAGTNAVSTIRNYLDQIGVRHAIPDMPYTIPSAGSTWKVHTAWSTFLNELCSAAGLYALHHDDQGRIVSKPVIASLVDEQSSHTYTIGRNSKLVGDIAFKPNGQSIFNRVVVVRDDPAQGTILTAVRSFTDPNSPYSTVNMGVKTKAYELQNVNSQAVVDAYADARIQDLSMFVYGEMKIIPSPFHFPYEVVNLDFQGNTLNPALGVHAGKYYVKSVSFDLLSSEGTMSISVRRTERFDNA